MALQWYNSMLSKRPLATKCVTSGCLGFLGYQICQSFDSQKDEQTKKGRDFVRSGIFGAVGLIYIGPMLHLNYSRVLPYLVPMCAKTPAWQLAGKKLAFD